MQSIFLVCGIKSWLNSIEIYWLRQQIGTEINTETGSKNWTALWKYIGPDNNI